MGVQQPAPRLFPVVGDEAAGGGDWRARVDKGRRAGRMGAAHCRGCFKECKCGGGRGGDGWGEVQVVRPAMDDCLIVGLSEAPLMAQA